jgi:hypothetical protein
MPSELSSLQEFCLKGLVNEGINHWNFEIESDSDEVSESEIFNKMQELGKKITEEFQLIARGWFIGSLQCFVDNCVLLKSYVANNEPIKFKFQNKEDGDRPLFEFTATINGQLFDSGSKPWRPLVKTKEIFLDYLITPQIRKICQGYDLSVVFPNYNESAPAEWNNIFLQQLSDWKASHSSNSLLFIFSPKKIWQAYLIENNVDDLKNIEIVPDSLFNEALMVQVNTSNDKRNLQILLRENVLFDETFHQKIFNANEIFQKIYNFLFDNHDIPRKYDDHLREAIQKLNSDSIQQNIKDSVNTLNKAIKEYVKSHQYNARKEELHRLVKNQGTLESQCGTLMTIIDKERKLNKSKSAKRQYDLVTDLVLNDTLTMVTEMLTNLNELALKSAIANPTEGQEAQSQYAKQVLDRSVMQCQQFAKQLSDHHGASSWQKKLAGVLLVMAGTVLAAAGAFTIIGTFGLGTLPGVGGVAGGVAFIAAGVGFFANGRHKNLKKTLDDVAKTVEEYKSKL